MGRIAHERAECRNHGACSGLTRAKDTVAGDRQLVAQMLRNIEGPGELDATALNHGVPNKMFRVRVLRLQCACLRLYIYVDTCGNV